MVIRYFRVIQARVLPIGQGSGGLNAQEGIQTRRGAKRGEEQERSRVKDTKKNLLIEIAFFLVLPAFALSCQLQWVCQGNLSVLF